MPRFSNRRVLAAVFSLALLFASIHALVAAPQNPESLRPPAVDHSAITNLAQLTHVVNAETRANRDVRLEVVVCAASRPKVGVLIVQDPTGVELLQLGDFGREIAAGERIRIEQGNVLLRKRAMGVELSASPVVDNDGIHARKTASGEVVLKKGRIPVRLEWFNCLREFGLEVNYLNPAGMMEQVSDSSLWHAIWDKSSGRTNVLRGLMGECYEGYWESVPDFDLLRPVKTGVATNFDVDFRTRDEMVGLRFEGYFDAPYDGVYTFRTRSHEGSLLFLGNWHVPVTPEGSAEVPAGEPATIGETVSNLDVRGWMTVDGRVDFVSRKGEGLEFELRSERESISVKLADARGVDPVNLLNSYIRVTGVGQGVLGLGKRVVLGRLMVASPREIHVIESAYRTGQLPNPLTTAREVQSLTPEAASKELPVRLRGVVTSANSHYDHWISIQDETRGIFVTLRNTTNSFPASGENWEVIGHTAKGDFAPVVVAEKVTYLGEGRMPEPARPTWDQLVNGSMDVQWAEFQGLVTDVETNNLSLILPEGNLNVQMEGYQEPELKRFLRTGVRIRGTLYATYAKMTREVRVGNILMRNASIDVEQPAPSNPFDAPVKKPHELFLFDAYATPFQRIKVVGQVIHAETNRLYLSEDGVGMRINPIHPVELKAGDRVEAVGYPEISWPSPVLHEAVIRKTGHEPLPQPRILSDTDNLVSPDLDSSLVRVQGKLVGWHFEQNTTVLEMQSLSLKTPLVFLARVPTHVLAFSLRPGSQLALTGVYRNSEGEAFELLLNSPANVAVLREPSWWTLQRLLTVVGVLLIGLMLAAVWITLLRRQVSQRTLQLRREIRERERVERQHALEAERSRIARDLHDDLGSSLTEISVLASTGRHSPPEGPGHPGLFRAIAEKAHGLISALDVIVWAVDPEENSLQSLADYLNSFVSEYLSNSGISCRFKIPVSLPPVMLEGRVRHDLLLAVKESLNNIVRHAKATEAEFRLAAAEDILEIVIADNGIGFDVASAKSGNGLENLSARLAKLGGSYTVTSEIGSGTTAKILLPLSTKRAA